MASRFIEDVKMASTSVRQRSKSKLGSENVRNVNVAIKILARFSYSHKILTLWLINESLHLYVILLRVFLNPDIFNILTTTKKKNFMDKTKYFKQQRRFASIVSVLQTIRFYVPPSFFITIRYKVSLPI